MKLGTIACLHGSLRNARKFASKFKKADVDAIVLAGDIAADEKQKQNLTKILKIFSKTGKLVFVVPGNHEQYDAYYGAIKKFRKNPLIVDTTKKKGYKIQDYKLVFLPGSGIGSAPGAGFRLLRDRKLLKRFRKRIHVHKTHFWGHVKPFFLNDLSKLMDKNTIVISHSPVKFNSPNAIDVAVFGEPKKTFVLLERHRKLDKTSGVSVMIKGTVIFTIDEAKGMAKKGYPIVIKQKNVGDLELKKVLRQRKVTKFICGDIHEAGGRAVSWKGKSIKPGRWSKELFYNCSAGKDGRAGIVEFSNGLAKYKNLRI